MQITKNENKRKEEIELIVEENITSNNIHELEKEIENIHCSIWQKLLLNFEYIDSLNLDALKMLWKEKQCFNSKQKAFEINRAKEKVAMSLKFSGFYKYFCPRNISFSSKKINEIECLGIYNEPIFKNEIKPVINLFENEFVDETIIKNGIEKLDGEFNLDIVNWTILSEQNENKIIFLIELENISNINIDAITEFLENFFAKKLKCSLYILEKGSFKEYMYLKKKDGIPEQFIKIPKIIFNPCDKKYFLGKIDERF